MKPAKPILWLINIITRKKKKSKGENDMTKKTVREVTDGVVVDADLVQDKGYWKRLRYEGSGFTHLASEGRVFDSEEKALDFAIEHYSSCVTLLRARREKLK